MSSKEDPDVKALRIKSGSVKRLGKEVMYHKKDLQGQEAKMLKLREERADAHALKKCQEFVDEGNAVVADTVRRLEKAVDELEEFLDYLDDEIRETEGFKLAEQIHKDGKTILAGRDPSVAVVAPASASDKGVFRVVVFGSSRCVKGDELFESSRRFGVELGSRGFHIVSGGYCGTMEAVSSGAREAGGDAAVVEGVLAPTVFPHRDPSGNGFLTHVHNAEGLATRIATLVDRGSAFVVLPGNTGTMAELCVAWNVATLSKLSGARASPIFAFRDPWEKFVQAVKPVLGVADDDIGALTFVDSVDDVVAKLEAARTAFAADESS